MRDGAPEVGRVGGADGQGGAGLTISLEFKISFVPVGSVVSRDEGPGPGPGRPTCLERSEKGRLTPTPC